MNSVMMEDEKKTSLLRDVSNYLENQQWYKDRGMPYRRGYLFYGPPGTGKTSSCTALAGHFKLPIYLVSLTAPGLQDHELQKLFDTLPKRCLLILEDVDSAGITRGNMKENSKTDRIPPVSLSGLLNVIDGPCSHEGRVLILTSNSPDALDAALVRPGRIDRKILFGNASREVMEKIFHNMFPDTELELARSFASKIPEDKLTPAEIQNFILENSENPAAAVEKVDEWVASVIATKTAGRNVSAFADQIGGDGEAKDESVTKEKAVDKGSGSGSEEHGKRSKKDGKKVERPEFGCM